MLRLRGLPELLLVASCVSRPRQSAGGRTSSQAPDGRWGRGQGWAPHDDGENSGELQSQSPPRTGTSCCDRMISCQSQMSQGHSLRFSLATRQRQRLLSGPMCSRAHAISCLAVTLQVVVDESSPSCEFTGATTLGAPRLVGVSSLQYERRRSGPAGAHGDAHIALIRYQCRPVSAR